MFKIRSTLIALVFMFSVFMPIAIVTSNVSAQNIKENLCKGTNLSLNGANVTQRAGESDADFEDRKASAGCTGTAANEDKLNKLMARIINIISVIIGIVAVIMIIIGGFKYVTSGGDSGKVGSAKSTILYAVIGLIVVAIAQFLVKFVLGQATSLVP